MNTRSLAASVLLTVLVVPAFAQKMPMKKMPMKPHMMTVMGAVKGAPMGKMFMLNTKMGMVKVDASKAKMMGKEKMCPTKAGETVTVKGMMSGMMIKADSVMCDMKMKKPMPMKSAPMKAMPMKAKGR